MNLLYKQFMKHPSHMYSQKMVERCLNFNLNKSEVPLFDGM